MHEEHPLFPEQVCVMVEQLFDVEEYPDGHVGGHVGALPVQAPGVHGGVQGPSF